MKLQLRNVESHNNLAVRQAAAKLGEKKTMSEDTTNTEQPPRGRLMNERTRELIKIMTTYRISNAQLAAMVQKSSGTVAAWRCEQRIIPATDLELLRIKCETLKTLFNK